ncbi:MAG TPA: arginine--tRNA ligase [Acidimicrobiales bacterium]|nr:arginine--tRNA ligase [Acidimicrobiales bacterium]
MADLTGRAGVPVTVTQVPSSPGRPGPFKLDMRDLVPERARDRNWLRELADQMNSLPGIAAAVPVPPSIYVRPDYHWLRTHVVPRVIAAGSSYGQATPPVTQTIALKFSNPNANKALHVGHLRTNFLGMAISRLLESQGSDVTRISVLSDWGIHICQAAVGYLHAGDGGSPSSVGMKGDHFVADFYVGFHQAEKRAKMDEEAVTLLRRAHMGNEGTRQLIFRITEWCEEGIKATYERIGTHLDLALLESASLATGLDIIAKAVEKRQLHRREDGSVYMNIPDIENGELTVVRSDGTPVVYTQWLGVDYDRHAQAHYDTDIVLFGDQWESGAIMYGELLKAVGLDWPQENICHGMVVTPSGAMSSRQGSGIRADDALNHFYHCFIELLRAEGRPVNTSLSETCEQLGVAFLKYALLAKPRKRAVEYDESALWEQQRRPFCQLVKTVVDLESEVGGIGPDDPEAFEAASDVIFALNAFPDVVCRSANERNPAALLRHLEDLSANVTRCDRLGGLDPDTRRATRIVMHRALHLLNIDLAHAIGFLSGGGSTLGVTTDTESASRRLVGLEPAKPVASLRSQGEPPGRQASAATASLITAVSKEGDRLVRLAAEPPRLGIPSAIHNAFGERCFEIDSVLEGEVVAILARHGGVRQVLSEESGVIPLGVEGCTVVLDPIDGTKNYKMGLSYYALSLAILADNGSVLGGLVLNLATGTQYSAIRGRGAFRNGRRITAGAPKQLSAMDVIFVGLSRTTPELGALSAVAGAVSSFRAMGCAALDLCCLATGNIGLFVDLSNTAKTVDVLAAATIAEEAGALVTTVEGEPILDRVTAATDVVETIYNWRFRTVGAATDELHAFCIEQCRDACSPEEPT